MGPAGIFHPHCQLRARSSPTWAETLKGMREHSVMANKPVQFRRIIYLPPKRFFVCSRSACFGFLKRFCGLAISAALEFQVSPSATARPTCSPNQRPKRPSYLNVDVDANAQRWAYTELDRDKRGVLPSVRRSRRHHVEMGRVPPTARTQSSRRQRCHAAPFFVARGPASGRLGPA